MQHVIGTQASRCGPWPAGYSGRVRFAPQYGTSAESMRIEGQLEDARPVETQKKTKMGMEEKKDRKKSNKAREGGALIKAVSKALAEKKSSTYRWLRSNHDKLRDELAATRPSWTVIAGVLATHGLEDATGKPPTASTVRRIWYRVRKDVQAARSRKPANQSGGTAPSESLTPGKLAPGVISAAPAAASPNRSPSLAPSITLAPRPSGPKLEIRPAWPRQRAPEPEPSKAIAIPATTADTDTTRVLQDMDATKVKIPKPI